MRKIQRICLVGVVGAGIAVGGVGVSNALTGSTEAPVEARVGDAVNPQPQASSGTGEPSYVPDGAELVRADRPADGSGAARYAYTLAGPANQSTITEEAMAAGEFVYPETEILVTYSPSIREIPEFIRESDEFFDTEQIAIGESSAVLTTPPNGLGVHRVDWVAEDGYHVVMVDRIRTDHGASGVPAAELVKIAESIPVG